MYRKCKTSTTATARSSIIVFHPVLFLLLCCQCRCMHCVCVCVCFSLQYPFPLPTASAAAAAAEHNKFLISFALYLLFFASITLQFLAQAKFLFPFFIAFPLSAYASSCIIPIVFCCLCCCFGSHFKYRLCVFVCLCCVNI